MCSYYFIGVSTIKNIVHLIFNSKSLDEVRFVQITLYPTVGEQLTAK